MIKKFLATITAVVIGVGISLVAVAAPASAHTGGLSGVAECQTDGTWAVTWTYDQTNTPGSGSGSQADVIVTVHEPMPSLVDGLPGTKYLNAVVGNENVNGQTGIPTRTGNWSQAFDQTAIVGSATTATATVTTFWKGWSSEATVTTKTIDLVGSCGEEIAIPVTTKSQMQCVNLLPKGSYTLPETEWVDWYVDGVTTTIPSEVTKPGDITVEARISDAGKAEGVTFTDGTTSHSVTHTFVVPEGGCELVEHPIVYPTSSSTPGTCAALPTYTVSDTEGVQWILGEDEPVEPGTHTAAFGQTVVLTATLPDPVNYGFDDDQQTEWEYTFAAAPKNCDLPTLALTGGSGPAGSMPWIAGAMLLLGAAGVFLQRRFAATR